MADPKENDHGKGNDPRQNQGQRHQGQARRPEGQEQQGDNAKPLPSEGDSEAIQAKRHEEFAARQPVERDTRVNQPDKITQTAAGTGEEVVKNRVGRGHP